VLSKIPASIWIRQLCAFKASAYGATYFADKLKIALHMLIDKVKPWQAYSVVVVSSSTPIAQYKK
jgi:hypothetical protein